jgi:hypothetical protein
MATISQTILKIKVLGNYSDNINIKQVKIMTDTI